MAKNGFRIFDSDTHVGPSMDVLETYMDPPAAKLTPYEEFRSVARRTGQVTYRMGGASTSVASASRAGLDARPQRRLHERLHRRS